MTSKKYRNVKLGDEFFVKAYKGSRIEAMYKTKVTKLCKCYFIVRRGIEENSAPNNTFIYRFTYDGKPYRKNPFAFYKHFLHDLNEETSNEYNTFWKKNNFIQDTEQNTTKDLHAWMSFITNLPASQKLKE
jgi:hypothetical protein